MWIELGLLVTFGVMVASLLLGFYFKARDKYGETHEKPMHATGKWRFFNRNHRSSDRMACDLRLELVDQTHLVKTGSARLLNLSTSGACMISRVTLSLGERIHGRIMSLDNERVKISGRVVWIRPGGAGAYYGIRFS